MAGRIGKTVCAIAGILCLTASSVQTAAADSAVSVEQIQCEMPDIDVYLHGADSLSANDVSAYLDSAQIRTASADKFSDTKEPLHCYILLDNSGSIDASYVEPVRDAVISFGNNLRQNDVLTVMTVGTQINTIYNGSGDEAALQEALEQYTAREQDTLLFEALVRAADSAGKELSAKDQKRCAAFVLSDGVNESVGSSVRDEAVSRLKEVQLPVHAFGIGNDADGLNNFGQLSRETGGDLTIIRPEDTEAALSGKYTSLLNDYRVHLQAANNLTGSQQELLLQISSLQFAQTVTLHPKRWKPDTEPPEISEVQQQKNGEIRISFSEPVTGADNPANYQLTDKDTNISISTVRYVEENDEYYALLVPGEEIYEGDYTVRLLNITEISQERNALQNNEYHIHLSGTEPYKKTLRKLWHQFWWVIPVFLIALIALIVLLVIRKHKGVVKVDGNIVFRDAVESKVHLRNAPGAFLQIQMTVKSTGAAAAEMTATITDVLVFGRSPKCSVYFDDPSMSRRHFQIRRENDRMLLSDCGSMSGTQLNGAAVTQETPLQSGDTVRAGMTEITVRW